jgi:hypothetical protein
MPLTPQQQAALEQSQRARREFIEGIRWDLEASRAAYEVFLDIPVPTPLETAAQIVELTEAQIRIIERIDKI